MKFKVQDLVEAALLVALSIGCGYIKIPIPPDANVSLAFIPLILIALRNGPIQTFLYTGVVYGLIDCLMDGWGLSTFPLEYLLAIGLLCIISLFRKELFYYKKDVVKEFAIVIVTVALWTTARWLLMSLDGFLHGWAPTMWASMIYNAANAYIDGGFALAVTLLIYYPLRPLNVKKFREDRWGKLSTKD